MFEKNVTCQLLHKRIALSKLKLARKLTRADLIEKIQLHEMEYEKAIYLVPISGFDNKHWLGIHEFALIFDEERAQSFVSNG